MSEEHKYIDSNPCEKSWDEMEATQDKKKKFCGDCSTYVYDLTTTDLLDLDQKTINGKCIVINNTQLDDLMFIHPLKRFAAALFIVFGSSLFIIPSALAQEKADTTIQSKTVTIKGRVVNKKGKPIKDCDVTLDSYGDFEYKLRTNAKGDFEVTVNRTRLASNFWIRIEKKKFWRTAHLEITEKNIFNLGSIELADKKRKKTKACNQVVGFI